MSSILVVIVFFVVATASAAPISVLTMRFSQTLKPTCDYPVWQANWTLPLCYEGGESSYDTANHTYLQESVYDEPPDQCKNNVIVTTYWTTENCTNVLIGSKDPVGYYYYHVWDQDGQNQPQLPHKKTPDNIPVDRVITVSYWYSLDCHGSQVLNKTVVLNTCYHDYLSYTFTHFRDQDTLLVAEMWTCGNYNCAGANPMWYYFQNGKCTYVGTSKYTSWTITW